MVIDFFPRSNLTEKLGKQRGIHPIGQHHGHYFLSCFMSCIQGEFNHHWHFNPNSWRQPACIGFAFVGKAWTVSQTCWVGKTLQKSTVCFYSSSPCYTWTYSTFQQFSTHGSDHFGPYAVLSMLYSWVHDNQYLVLKPVNVGDIQTCRGFLWIYLS